MKKRFAKANTNMLIGVLVAAAVVLAAVALARLDVFGKKRGGLGSNFRQDLEKYARIDPDMILYGESAEPIKTQLENPRAVVVDSKGLVYVAGDNRVNMLDAGGTVKAVISPTAEPYSLAVADDGKVYVGAEDHIEVYDDQQKRIATWPAPGEKSLLTSIAVTENDVFVADQGSRLVFRYDLSGKLIAKIGAKDPDKNILGFIVPSPYFDLAMSRDGMLRVANPGRGRIEAYTFDGNLEFHWGKLAMALDTFLPCCNPVNFAILPDGSFVTSEKGITRVKIYDSDGGFVGVVAGPEQLLQRGAALVQEQPSKSHSGAFDVAVDMEGRVYVLDTIENAVRIFTKKKAG